MRWRWSDYDGVTQWYAIGEGLMEPDANGHDLSCPWCDAPFNTAAVVRFRSQVRVLLDGEDVTDACFACDDIAGYADLWAEHDSRGDWIVRGRSGMMPARAEQLVTPTTPQVGAPTTLLGGWWRAMTRCSSGLGHCWHPAGCCICGWRP